MRLIKLKQKHGMTLLETIITMGILTVFTILCIAMMQSALRASQVNDNLMRDQAALRQALLVIARDLRTLDFVPAEDALNGMYQMVDDTLQRFSDSTVIATGISARNFAVTGNRVSIEIIAVNNQSARTTIHLRV